MIKNNDLSNNIENDNESNDLPDEVGEDETSDLPEEIDQEKSDLPDEVIAESNSLESEKDKNGNDEFAEEEANDSSENTREGLSEEEKDKAREETGWSDEILDAIGSWEEYEIYRDAGLVEAEIGGKKCLIRNDIDWDQKDEKGRTNAERIKRGLAPLDKNGNPIQLHHIGQHADSPLAELTFEEHRCNGNDTILHNKKMPTETHGEGNTWDDERKEYWTNRAEYNKKNEGAGD